ncbi:MAG: histidinol-phosphate transaminase [Bacteroidales bacterium]|nr:histidinol-phosphate transaminase [Bacteroidales bacterium]
MNLQALVRPNIWNLVPYSSARSEFTGAASVFLDANENPFNNPYNRYPDPLQQEVKALIAQLRGVAAGQIFLGVGSDECIDVVYRTFCRPGVDNVVAIAPSYGMYEVCADINDVEYRRVPLNDDFSLNADALLATADERTKVMWICSPNNPTGNAFALDEIEAICSRFAGIVVVDEAYIDFSTRGSMLSRLDSLPNLIVMQTLSKAWGSASVRLGIAYASAEIIGIFNKVKYPYNINLLTQRYAIDLLKRHSEVTAWVKQLTTNRQWLIEALGSLRCVKYIYPTDANFVLVRVSDADAIYDYLRAGGIIVRNRNRVEKCLGCLRITVGTAEENEKLINALKEYGKE